MKNMRKGFTLIELLVVIAIIAILAAILFPVFAKAREKARQTSCTSNLKQLALGFIQYSQDYDEAYPGGGGTQAVQNYSGEAWASQIFPYEKSTGVYKCQDDTANAGADTESYAYNLNLGVYQAGLTTLAGMNTTISSTSAAKLTSPVTTVLLYEANDSGTPTPGAANQLFPIGTGQDQTSAAAAAAATTILQNAIIPTASNQNATGPLGARGAASGLAPRHDPSSIFACADGHVKTLRPEKVSSGVTPAAAGSGQSSANGGMNTIYTSGSATACSTDQTGSPYTLTFSPL